jgi:uncharacterized Zn-binding protein involved in type VI secretion
MGQRPFIILGDQTDHGGVVIEASVMTDTHGKGIARVGDQVTCPKRGHGTTVIVSGDPTMIIDGKPAARHGDKTACGATLISGQFVSTVGDGGGGGGGGSGASVAATASQPAAKAKGLFTSLMPEVHAYDIHFLVNDEVTGRPAPNIPYKLTLADGTTVTGRTDENGLTEKISSNTEQTASIEAPYYGDSASSTDSHREHFTCYC